jgi:heme-degrading monooxygenase HmoA
MFTRVVELRAKPGKTKELASTASEKVLPILKKQQGFQDEMVLVSNTDPNRVLALSFWNSREDAERYHREQFSQITEMIRNFCDGEPRVETYDVNTSTIHRINSEKAA